MLPERQIEMVHFQITKNCNLNCWFCGQWGTHGSFLKKTDAEMTLDNWEDVIDSLVRYSDLSGYRPAVIIWGGEPLLTPLFSPVVNRLYNLGFTLGLVTNGTLIDQNLALCRKAFRQIYISIDGSRKVHDAIRGEGVFDKVKHNISLLKGGRAQLILMSVLTPAITGDLEKTIKELSAFQPDQLLLQEMIALSREEIQSYKEWMLEQFQTEAIEIDAWVIPDGADAQTTAHTHSWYEEWLELHPSPFPIQHLPHGAQTNRYYCLSPFRHIHIAWNGNVNFCTDFTDFSAGNVKQEDLTDIFNGERAAKFMTEIFNGRCITCEHCSWRNNTSFHLD